MTQGGSNLSDVHDCTQFWGVHARLLFGLCSHHTKAFAVQAYTGLDLRAVHFSLHLSCDGVTAPFMLACTRSDARTMAPAPRLGPTLVFSHEGRCITTRRPGDLRLACTAVRPALPQEWRYRASYLFIFYPRPASVLCWSAVTPNAAAVLSSQPPQPPRPPTACTTGFVKLVSASVCKGA